MNFHKKQRSIKMNNLNILNQEKNKFLLEIKPPISIGNTSSSHRNTQEKKPLDFLWKVDLIYIMFNNERCLTR